MTSTEPEVRIEAETSRIEGEVKQVLEPEELDGYMIRPEVRAGVTDRLVVLWSDVPRWQRVVDSNRLLGLLSGFVTPFVPGRFMADVDVVNADLDVEVGDEISLEVAPAVCEATITRGGIDCEVGLWDVAEAGGRA